MQYTIIKINYGTPIQVGSVSTLEEAFDAIKHDPLLFVEESALSVRVNGCSYAHLIDRQEAVAV